MQGTNAVGPPDLPPFVSQRPDPLPPLKTQVKTPIPPLSNPSLYSKIGFVMGWMTEISGLSPPLKSQVQTVIPPLSNPSLHTFAFVMKSDDHFWRQNQILVFQFDI